MDLMDRIFWGMAGFIGIHFLWLGLLEAYLHLAAGSALAFIWLIWFVARGWRRLPGSRGRPGRSEEP